jgi:hypothetical protein
MNGKDSKISSNRRLIKDKSNILSTFIQKSNHIVDELQTFKDIRG